MLGQTNMSGYQTEYNCAFVSSSIVNFILCTKHVT